MIDLVRRMGRIGCVAIAAAVIEVADWLHPGDDDTEADDDTPELGTVVEAWVEDLVRDYHGPGFDPDCDREDCYWCWAAWTGAEGS